MAGLSEWSRLEKGFKEKCEKFEGESIENKKTISQLNKSNEDLREINDELRETINNDTRDDEEHNDSGRRLPHERKQNLMKDQIKVSNFGGVMNEDSMFQLLGLDDNPTIAEKCSIVIDEDGATATIEVPTYWQ